MKNPFKILSTIVFLLLLVVLSCTFASCSTKHKVVETETKVERLDVNETVSVLEKKDIVSTSETKAVEEKLSWTIFDQIELEQADPLKTITITDPSGKTTTITGANAVITSREDAVIEKKEINENTTFSDTSTTDSKAEKETSSVVKSDSRKADSKSMRTSTFISIGIGAAIFALIIIWYIRRKTKTV